MWAILLNHRFVLPTALQVCSIKLYVIFSVVLAWDIIAGLLLMLIAGGMHSRQHHTEVKCAGYVGVRL